MKKTALILIVVLTTILASGADCDKLATNASASDFTVVTNGANPAVAVVAFCENSEFVINVFYLGIDSHDNNTHLFVHELILHERSIKVEDAGWKRFGESLNGCKRIQYAVQNGSCDKEGDFTRRVGTGSGVMGDKAPCVNFEYRICGHGNQVKYDTNSPVNPPPQW